MLCYNLLIAEDEPKLRNIIRDYFQNKGFKVTEVSNGMSALEAAKDRDFDIILLDVMMPRLDGFSVCRAIRKEQDVPIMFLTAKIEEEDQLAGYQAQADDYVTKPFSLPVLHAKVQALLQRRNGTFPGKREICCGEIKVDPDTRTVLIEGQKVTMTPKVYDLLVYMMENRNRILTREQILDQVWGQDVFCYNRAVDTTIKKLRKALGNQAGCIRTIVGIGYSFQEEEDE